MSRRIHSKPMSPAKMIDFSDMDSVRVAAAEILSRFPVIDGLVLSVGAYIQNGPTMLPNGHEAMFATNVMGPFLFTELLAERLQESKPHRGARDRSFPQGHRLDGPGEPQEPQDRTCLR
jgi:NAD(P)-dependent dehydrogenase (short-subunit alcohol dehydrogenase family)